MIEISKFFIKITTNEKNNTEIVKILKFWNCKTKNLTMIRYEKSAHGDVGLFGMSSTTTLGRSPFSERQLFLCVCNESRNLTCLEIENELIPRVSHVLLWTHKNSISIQGMQYTIRFRLLWDYKNGEEFHCFTVNSTWSYFVMVQILVIYHVP